MVVVDNFFLWNYRSPEPEVKACFSSDLRGRVLLPAEVSGWQRQQATSDSLQQRPAPEAGGGVQEQQIPNGGPEVEAVGGAGTGGEPGQDLVPEQEGETEEN